MMDESEFAKMEKGKDVAVAANRNESQKEDNQRPPTIELPRTLELRKNGYLALARNWESGVYDSPGLPSSLTSQVSGGFDFMGRQTLDHLAAAGIGDKIQGFRQSSLDTEPQTLPVISVRQAKDGAIEIIETYDQEEAVHLFLKDAEDEHLREEALAAVLPTSELGISL